MAKHRPKKIALIGAKGFEHSSPEVQVECFPWNRLKRVTNLADYDIMILDLLSIDASCSLDVPAFRHMLDIHTAQQILSKTESAIFVFGDPRFAIEWKSDDAKHEEPFLAWTGLKFRWDGRPGTTVESEELPPGSFERFADKLTRWDYSLVACRPNPEEFAKLWDLTRLRVLDEEPKVLTNKICTKSYGNNLVLLSLTALSSSLIGIHNCLAAGGPIR